MTVLPTVEEVLALPELRRGKPQLVAGAAGLGRRVRWAHVSELADIASLLRGGELVLTTGIALPQDDSGLGRYVADLAEAGASGIVIELGRRFATVPTALVAAAGCHQLPLVALHREVRFVSVTEAVHSLIVNAQVAQLRLSDEVHKVFTTLSVEGASAVEILRHAAGMVGAPVVLEGLTHRVLACEAAGADPDELLRDWEARSRRARLTGRTGTAGPEGWLVTPVGARGELWGRLVLLADGEVGSRQVTVLERAATALALQRLVERDQESLERQAHRTLLSDVLGHGYGRTSELHARARALGVPTERRALTGVVVRLPATGGPDGIDQQARDREVAEAVARAVAAAAVRALVAPLQRAHVGALLATAPPGRRPATLERIAVAIHAELPGSGAVIGVGSTVDDLDGVRRSLLEARQAAEAGAGVDRAKPYYELADVRLRGVLHLLRDDARVQAFVERELGPLLAHDQRHGTDLLPTLWALLEHGGNKSAAAAAYHLSRPAFYHRLATIERVLAADLGSTDTRLSLHVAMLALEAQGSRM